MVFIATSCNKCFACTFAHVVNNFKLQLMVLDGGQGHGFV